MTYALVDEVLARNLFVAFVREFPLEHLYHKRLAIDLSLIDKEVLWPEDVENTDVLRDLRSFGGHFSNEVLLWIFGFLGSYDELPVSATFSEVRKSMIAARKTRPLAETSPGVSVLYSTNIWYDSTGTFHWEETMIDGQVTTEGYITYRGLLVGPSEIEPVDA
jgi:hypothetical protein